MFYSIFIFSFHSFINVAYVYLDYISLLRLHLVPDHSHFNEMQVLSAHLYPVSNIHTYVYIVTKSEWHIMLVYEYMLIIINVIMIMIIVYAGKRIPAADAVVRLSS